MMVVAVIVWDGSQMQEHVEEDLVAVPNLLSSTHIIGNLCSGPYTVPM